MKRYIALLRGINVSGKNKIAMGELKMGFVELGFAEVATYLNSGNVIFSCENEDAALLVNKIEAMIKDRFAFAVPVAIVLQEQLKELLSTAPDWWGDDDQAIYDNLIFMMPPLTYEELYAELGSPKTEYEKVHHAQQVVFWSFSRKDYQRTNWWSRTASSRVSDRITIRTANTVRKIANM